ncbi:hypothetical protein [Pseudoroseomonas cervicalis]|uniref:hypothetical protein n=1 Tax=Teichococcus cervicalis TaxID=204525 RepID=UPI00277EC1AA|nr:hypothetical protein [Pseudoroseomonas cervicalis]MDQ1081427.1 hypothetical protein [Pseudoroseomonas cervicalis]
MQMECGIAADRKTAVVTIDRELDAAELEALIEDLMACRAGMEPRRLPVMFPGSRILVGAGFHLQAEDGGKMLAAIHHPGFGWIGSEVTPSDLERAEATAQANR